MLTLLLAAWAYSAPVNYLTDRELRIIQGNLDLYHSAAAMAGVPTMALPAIHRLESDLKDACRSLSDWKTCNVGGPMMMDMGGDGTTMFEPRIRAREKWIAAKYCIFPVPRVRDDLAFSILCAAAELRGKARGSFWNRRGQLDMEVLGDALWGYNGRAYGSWRKSPYVWNHPKKGRRMVMRWRTKDGVNEAVCDRPGALVLYYELVRRIPE